MKVVWGLGVMKMVGISSGGSGFRQWAICLPLFFWIPPLWVWVERVARGGGIGSLFRW